MFPASGVQRVSYHVISGSDLSVGFHKQTAACKIARRIAFAAGISLMQVKWCCKWQR